MRIDSTCSCGSSEAMTSLSACVLLLAAVSSVINAVTDSDTGRTFILNPDYLPWDEANRKCKDMNGILGTIDQLHVIPELGYDEGWTLWVGLRVNSSHDITWEDGKNVDWTNWYTAPDRTGEDVGCVSAITSPPYSWILTSCNETLPSLCEIAGGSCRFTLTSHASLRSFNERLEYLATEECLEVCETIRDMDCRSVEDNREANLCQLSSQSRWMQPQSFITGDRYWDYYHFTCINGTYLGGIYVSPNGAQLPSTEAVTTTTATTTEATTTTSTTSSAPTTVTEPTEDGELVCVKVKHITENDTEEVQEEVQQLQTLSLVYKEQKKMKKKISTPDARPSATYVGSLAVGLVLAILSVIVCLDLMSMPRHIAAMGRKGSPCGKCVKKLKKKKLLKRSQEVQFSEYSERSTSGTHQGPLVIRSKVPRNFRPQSLGEDDHLENTYCNGLDDTRSNKPVNRKLELHLERIRRLDREYGGRSSEPPDSGPSQLLDEEAVRVERNPEDSASSVFLESETAEHSRYDAALSVNGLQDKHQPGHEEDAEDNKTLRSQSDNDAVTGKSVRESSPSDVQQQGKSVVVDVNGVFREDVLQTQPSFPHVEVIEVSTAERQKHETENGGRTNDLSTLLEQVVVSNEQTETEVGVPDDESPSGQNMPENDRHQKVITSNTVADDEDHDLMCGVSYEKEDNDPVCEISGGQSSTELPSQQTNIEIQVEEVASPAEDTEAGYPGLVNVDDDLLKVEGHPRRLEAFERRFHSQAKRDQAWL